MSSKDKAVQPAQPAEQTAVVSGGIDYGSDIGHGMEQADAQSYAIPFLTVIQKMSPICDEASGSYNADAKAGQIMNTVTGERFDGKEGVYFVMSQFQRRFLRWAPREVGGGFKGELTAEAAAAYRDDGLVVELDGRLYFPEADGSANPKKNDRLADVRNHFGVLENTKSNMLLSLGSTQIKKSKALLSMLAGVKVKLPNGNSVTPPSWASRIHMTTVLEQNDQGSWYGVKFELAGLVTDPELYAAGKDFYAALSKGVGGEVRYEEDVAQSGVPADKF